jgi:putative transposase
MKNEKEIYRRHLPHIQPKGGLFFITWTLKGSIPKSKLLTIKKEYESLINKVDKTDEEIKKIKILARKNYINNIDKMLSENYTGPHYMKDERIAKIVTESLHFWDNKSIELYCYCIMSNHVHSVFRLLEGSETDFEKRLDEIMHSIKRFSAREANKILNRQGQFWEEESFDYLIRNQQELERIIEYILNNPVKAGLCKNWNDWKWSYSRKGL